MKTITVEITDKTYNEIRKAIVVRQLSGESFGLLDQALKKIIQAIEEQETVVTLKMKKEQNSRGESNES